MAFAHAGSGDLHKFGLGLHGFDGGAAAIAHGGTQPPGHLVDDVDHRAFVGHPAFNALRDQLVGIGIAGRRLLKIPVCAALLHGANAAHAPVTFVTAALVQHDFARRLFGAGKHAPHHHGGGPGGNGLGDVAAVANAAIGNQRDARPLQRFSHAVNGGDLGHAHTGNDAGGANRARPNADLDRVCTRIGQSQGSGACGNVAAHHINLGVVLFDPAHPFDHALAVAMRGVDHDHIHASVDQSLHPLFGALTHAHGRAHAQAPC